MDGAGAGAERALRALVATLAVVGVSAAAHRLGGGMVPGPMALVVLSLLIGPPTWVVLGLRPGRCTRLLLVGAAQLVTHLGLRAMAPDHGTGSAAHVHGGLPAGLAPSEADVTAVMPEMPPMPWLDAPMLALHLVATVLLAALLHHAEEAVWRVVRRLLPAGCCAPRPRVLVRVVAWRTVAVLTGRTLRPIGGRAPPLAIA